VTKENKTSIFPYPTSRIRRPEGEERSGFLIDYVSPRQKKPLKITGFLFISEKYYSRRH